MVDTLILDVKAFDSESFEELTTINGFDTYLDFITNLDSYGFQGQVWIRHVMVPGFTDNEQAMKGLVQTIKPINHRVDRIEILPYHTSGVKNITS